MIRRYTWRTWLLPSVSPMVSQRVVGDLAGCGRAPEGSEAAQAALGVEGQQFGIAGGIDPVRQNDLLHAILV